MATSTLKAQFTVQIVIGLTCRDVEREQNAVTCCMSRRYTVSQREATREHSPPRNGNQAVGQKAGGITKKTELRHKANRTLRRGGTAAAKPSGYMDIRKDSAEKVT